MLESSLTLHRLLLLGSWSGEYCFRAALNRIQLSELVDHLLREVLPSTVWKEESLRDMKGRDRNRYIGSAPPHAYATRGEELSFIAGKIFTEESMKKSEPFALNLLSKFTNFDGNAHITHGVTILREGSLTEEFPPNLIARSVPIELEIFRFGIDLFFPRFFSMLGSSPVVTQSLLIECDQSSCVIQITLDSLKHRNDLPFQRDNLFEKMGRVCGQIFGVNIQKDYLKKLATEN